MLISVLIPTYNGGKFIKRTLNSILKYNHNILIWVYIDGSTDNTLEIINKMGSNKIKWIYSPINRGVNYARRKLFERVETKWFAYCDDDDVYTKKAFKYMLKTIKPESNFVTGTMLIKKNMFVKHVFNGEFKQILNPSLRKVLEKSGTSMNNHLFKSSFFRKLKYDPPPHAQMQEDVCF
ncbi:MAG: glycosyltransferase family 2 protein [Rickettsiales bacterium]|jgi:glycosyltransferase involved in cell wall biosynthesis|nr:glycosyltransferase family 2 protein [Rickettsiales bacterium]